MPSLVHENLVDSNATSNNIFAIGAGARVKLTQRSSVSIEYFYTFPGTRLPGTYPTFSVGYEIETGGHVFQVHLSSSTGMTEKNIYR
jgi:opacity protein-like surface antigen